MAFLRWDRKNAVLLVVLAVFCSSGSARDAFMDELEDAMTTQSVDKKYLPSDEELALYDRNGNGKIDQDEMAKYLKDTLEKVAREASKREKQSEQKKNKLHSNLGKRELGIGLVALILLAGIVVVVFRRNSGSSSATGKVAVENVRTARLRRLALETPQNQDSDRNMTQRTPTLDDVKMGKPPDRNISPIGSRESDIRKRPTQRSDHNQCSPGGKITSEGTVESSVKAALSSTINKEIKKIPAASTGGLTRKGTEKVSPEKSVKKEGDEKVSPEKSVKKEGDDRKAGLKERGGSTKQKVEMSYQDAMKSVLPHLLDFTLKISEGPVTGKTLPLRSHSQPAELELKPTDLPQDGEDKTKKIEKLFLKRICLELEPMKFAMKCRERCSLALPSDVSGSSNGARIWSDVTTIIKESCTITVLKHLSHASTSPTTAEDDLWSDFHNTGDSQGPALYFLAAMSGWSSDGISVSPEFLAELLEKGNGDPHVKDTFLEMVVSVGKYVHVVKNTKRMDEIALECSRVFKGLESLIKQPRMMQFITDALDKEVTKSTSELWIYFQTNSIFSTFLTLTTLEAKISGKSRASEPFKQLPHFPQVFQSDAERVQSQIQDGIHSCQNVVQKVLRRVLSKNQESALAWISAVVSLNDLRTATLVSDQYEDVVAGDGYMMNLCSVLLQLCEPFFLTKGADKLLDINTNYPVSEACRLEYPSERTIAGRHLGDEGEETVSKRSYRLSDDLKGRFNLKTEVFHLTHRALHIGLTNTIQHYNRLLRNYLLIKERSEGKESQAHFDGLLTLFVSQWDTVIQDHQFMRMCSEFYITTAYWIVMKMEHCVASNKDLSDQEIHERERELLSCIPEFYIKDMCTWFHYVVVHNPNTLKGLNVYKFVDCSATLMNNKGCRPGPMVASKIVSALLAFAECCSKKKKHQSLLETSSWGSGIEGDLTACVVTCQAIKKKLSSALIHTYTSVDVVEGLDVDKEEFDKFSSRAEIVKLLELLWTDVDHRDSLKLECGKNTFQSFLNAILDSLLYLLNDGLSRVQHVRKLQKSKEDKEKWNELDFQEQQEKAQFLKNEEHVSKSFMKMANNTLEFLAMITEEKRVARCFLRPPISQRAASAIIGFLDSLCGPKSLELKVKNMEKYSFNPRELLVKLVSVLLHITQAGKDENEPEFTNCVAADPDYCRRNIAQAHRVLKREGLISEDMLRDLRDVLAQCDEYRSRVLGETSRASDEPVGTSEGTLERTTSPGEDEERENLVDNIGEATAQANTDEAYIETLRDARYDTIELMDHTAFQCCRNQPVCQRSVTVRTIMREITQLKDNLPVHPNSSIIVRQDEDRLDFIRAMITGPVETPYSRGCFVFDVYFPGTYPSVPPLVKLITTGNGTVRFNPNLYADGKVCLSLLGTWHGGDASEKWDSKHSSLYQVLLSIQGMILIPDPCFNEPGYEGIRGTAEGDALSREYNAGIRLATIRHAIVGQLRHPTQGLEDVIRTHFRLQRDAVFRQCSDWLQQCATPEEERRMRKAFDELKTELDKL